MKTVIINALSIYLNLLAHISPATAGRVGFKIFCRPFRSKLNEKHLKFYSSAQQSVIEHEGEKIKMLKWGSGHKSVLFLHGWQSFSYRWKAYIQNLDPKEYSIYAFDAPGHGMSTGNFLSVPLYSDIIEKVFASIGETDTIVAHSLGGFTALYTLSRLPEHQVKKLVLMAPPGEATEFFTFYQQSLKLSDVFISLTINRFKEIFGKSPEFFSAPQFSKDITIPGLIIHDKGDDETSVKNSVNINKSWPESKLIITEGAGHNLKSKDVLEEVLNFIKK